MFFGTTTILTRDNIKLQRPCVVPLKLWIWFPIIFLVPMLLQSSNGKSDSSSWYFGISLYFIYGIGDWYFKFHKERELLRQSSRAAFKLILFREEAYNLKAFNYPVFLNDETGEEVEGVFTVDTKSLVKGEVYEVFYKNNRCIPLEFSSWKYV